jgi:hypothetical protein
MTTTSSRTAENGRSVLAGSRSCFECWARRVGDMCALQPISYSLLDCILLPSLRPTGCGPSAVVPELGAQGEYGNMTHLLRPYCTAIARELHGRDAARQASGRRRLAHSAPGSQRPAGRVIESHTSLGYEPTDVRLSRLGQSPVAALASADWRYEVIPGLLRLPRLSMSRRVSCTNACTNQPPGLLVRVGQHDRPIWRTTGTGGSDP